MESLFLRSRRRQQHTQQPTKQQTMQQTTTTAGMVMSNHLHCVTKLSRKLHASMSVP